MSFGKINNDVRKNVMEDFGTREVLAFTNIRFYETRTQNNICPHIPKKLFRNGIHNLSHIINFH